VSPEPLRRPSELGEALPVIEFHEWTDPVYRIQDDDRISSRSRQHILDGLAYWP